MDNAKRLWLTTNTGTSLAVTCLCLITLQACSPKYPDQDKSKTDNNNSTSTTTDGGKSNSTKSGTEITPGNSTQPDKAATNDKGASGAGEQPEVKNGNSELAAGQSNDPTEDPMALFRQLPMVKAASEKVDLRNMPDSDVILTVRGAPITVGDYKLELKLRQEKASVLISNNPQMQAQLVHEAASRNIALTAEEKKKVVEMANKAQDSADILRKSLKEHKITPKDYAERTLQLGLALKTAAVLTRETLLNELVDQQLLIVAAKDKDFYKKAFNQYIEIKHKPEYQKVLQETGLTPDQAQKQIIDKELIDLYIQVIKDANSTISDAEYQKFYDDNKKAFKHGERYRISQIVLAAPSDAKDQPGIKEQLKSKFPTLSDKDLEAKAVQLKSEQKKLAEDILARIQKGEKFETLANQFTQDPGNQSLQNGGDIGWKEKDSLEPDFVSKITTLKPGQVYPHVLSTRFGYHILKLNQKEGPGTISLEDVKKDPEIQQALLQKKQIRAIADWLSALHKTPGAIKISPQFLKLIAAPPEKTNK